MKKVFTVFAALLLLLGALGSAEAFTSYIEIRPVGQHEVDAGDPFNVDIYLVGDGTETLFTYGFDIGFDATELTYVDAVELWPAPPYVPPTTGYMDLTLLEYFDETKTVGAFDGMTLPFGAPGKLIDDIHLGTIEFIVNDPVKLFDGDDDVWVHYRAGMGVTIDNVIVFPESTGPSVGAVPIPGALWLLGSGLLGMIGIRRHRRK